MPYPFVLPTTSAVSFSSSLQSESFPSLPVNASSHRGVVRDALKKHKRLPPASQVSNLPVVASSLNEYLPYLLTLDHGLPNAKRQTSSGEAPSIVMKSMPNIEWRPTLSGEIVPGKERARVKVPSFAYEIAFTLSTLAFTHVLSARASLHPLYTTNVDLLSTQERTTAITSATKYLLDAASISKYLAERGEMSTTSPPCVDVAPATQRALAALALAEATLLSVLKDDPYPAIVAQDRNKNDKEWMFKAPDIPKVRAHLYARLSLAASEHAARAASLCQKTGSASTKINSGFVRYLEDLRRTCRAKACRFFGIDAELGGKTAEGIGWLRAGLQELGIEVNEPKKGMSFSRFRKDLTEKREDRRVEKESSWGADGGKLEEMRVIEMLDLKWNKINDTMNTQVIPPPNSLLTKMPTGREIYTIKPYEPPTLSRNTLEEMRAPPERDDFVDDLSSDDENRGQPVPVGAYPGTEENYGRESSMSGSTLF